MTESPATPPAVSFGAGCADGAVDAGGGSETALLRFFRALREARIPFWVIDGYGGGSFDPIDVDILVPRAALGRRIPELLHVQQRRIGARLISWDRDNQFVLACDPADPSAAPEFLRIHLRPDFRRVGRFFYDGDAVLRDAASSPALAAADEDPESFCRPATPVQFACYLIEKIAKSGLTHVHQQQLGECYRRDPKRCEQEIRRHWPADCAELITAAVRSGKWDSVQSILPRLRHELRRRAARRRPAWTMRYRLCKALRRVRNFARPRTGLHVALLGPDGVGKSTVIDRLLRDLEPAFCGTHYGTFAPGLLPKKTTDGGKPHAKPPRSLPASLAKGAWWVIYYSLGYYATTRPAVAEGALALNHRYCADVLVDRRRYRYAGPQWLLDLAWKLARKPDLIVLLDAPAEVVHARKQEIAFEEVARQRAAYRALIEPLPNGTIVDASRPADEVIADVEQRMLKLLVARTVEQLGLSERKESDRVDREQSSGASEMGVAS